MKTNSARSKEYIDDYTPLNVRKKNVLLIDDDPAFRSLLAASAKSTIVNITALSSLKHLSTPKKIKEYDAVILDYYLESLNGLQVAQYLETFFPDTPVILISGHVIFNETDDWPDCIKMFCPKHMGVENILDNVEDILNDQI